MIYSEDTVKKAYAFVVGDSEKDYAKMIEKASKKFFLIDLDDEGYEVLSPKEKYAYVILRKMAKEMDSKGFVKFGKEKIDF